MLSALLLFMIEPAGFRDSDPMLSIRFCVVVRHRFERYSKRANSEVSIPDIARRKGCGAYAEQRTGNSTRKVIASGKHDARWL